MDAKDSIPIIVAILALIGVILNAAVTGVQGRKVRDQAAKLAAESGGQAERLAKQVDERESAKASRGDWWGRFNDTVPRLSAGEVTTRKLAVEVLTELALAKWVQEEDRRLTLRILQIYTQRAVDEMSQPGGNSGHGN